MPRIGETNLSKLRKIKLEFPLEFTKAPNVKLYCKLCECNVKFDKHFQVESHRSSARYQFKLEYITTQLGSASTQTFILSNSLATDVAMSFTAANIPLKKLRHASIKSFFTKLGKECPIESNCRSKVESISLEAKEVVKNNLNGKQILMMIDESDI